MPDPVPPSLQDAIGLAASNTTLGIDCDTASMLVGTMLNDLQAVPAFVALGHQVRLDAFRLLIRTVPDGLPSGEIAAALSVPPTAMSFHLATLERAGLVVSRRDGRHIRYAVDVARVRDLVTFLTADCCGGHPEICAGLAGPTGDPDKRCGERNA
jgi:ArsR family transcriptional regulator